MTYNGVELTFSVAPFRGIIVWVRDELQQRWDGRMWRSNGGTTEVKTVLQRVNVVDHDSDWPTNAW